MEALVTAIVGLLIVVLVLGPLVRHAVSRKPTAVASESHPEPRSRQPVKPPRSEPVVEPSEPPSLDVGRIEGRISNAANKRIGGIIDKHPGEAASVLKKWMSSDD